MVCIIMVLLIIIGVIVLLISAITEKKSDSPKLENEEKKYEQYYDDIGNYNMNMNINGKTFAWSGGSMEINNGKVIVDGRIIDEYNSGDIRVIIKGDVNKIECAGSVEVHGNATKINCCGSCEVGGDVNGDIIAAGPVTCKNSTGNVSTGGSIKYGGFWHD